MALYTGFIKGHYQMRGSWKRFALGDDETYRLCQEHPETTEYILNEIVAGMRQNESGPFKFTRNVAPCFKQTD